MTVAIILPLNHPERDIDAETARKMAMMFDIALWVRTLAEVAQPLQEEQENEAA